MLGVFHSILKEWTNGIDAVLIELSPFVLPSGGKNENDAFHNFNEDTEESCMLHIC